LVTSFFSARGGRARFPNCVGGWSHAGFSSAGTRATCPGRTLMAEPRLGEHSPPLLVVPNSDALMDGGGRPFLWYFAALLGVMWATCGAPVSRRHASGEDAVLTSRKSNCAGSPGFHRLANAFHPHRPCSNLADWERSCYGLRLQFFQKPGSPHF